MLSLLTLLAGLSVPLPTPAADTPATWTFEARLSDDFGVLELRACGDSALPRVQFHAGRGAAAHLLSARRSSDAELLRRGDELSALNWAAAECLSAQISMAAAAKAERRGQAQRPGHYLRSSPAQWLWRPRELHAESVIRFELPAGWSVSVPWQPHADGSYRLGSTPSRWPGQVAFGRFTEHTVDLPGGRLRISVMPSVDDIDESGIVAWLTDVANQLTLLGGEFPQSDTQVLVHPLPGVAAAVPWGEITRGGGSAVHLHVGLAAGVAGWRADWTASHEFAHLLHPFLGDAGRWLSEGLASYYQNVLRARSREFSAETAWLKLRQGFERGSSASRDDPRTLQQVAAGRVRQATMRVYWAGAAFWLETDRALRQHGDSLDALLMRFARRHGRTACCWTPARFMRALQALAPSADLISRHARYAESSGFPLDASQLADFEQELAQPDSLLRGILAPRPQVTASRSNAR